MNHFFAYISKMRWIKRWGLMKNTVEENDMEHSWQVSVVAHALAVIKNEFFCGETDPEHIAVLALFHECGEVVTGDIATPIKYANPGVKSAIKTMEDDARASILNMLPSDLKPKYADLVVPDEDSEDYRIVKAADRICAYLKCLEERKSGNREFIKAEESILRDIKNLKRPEVDYFMDKFTDSFTLTLDELN